MFQIFYRSHEVTFFFFKSLKSLKYTCIPPRFVLLQRNVSFFFLSRIGGCIRFRLIRWTLSCCNKFVSFVSFSFAFADHAFWPIHMETGTSIRGKPCKFCAPRSAGKSRIAQNRKRLSVRTAVTDHTAPKSATRRLPSAGCLGVCRRQWRARHARSGARGANVMDRDRGGGNSAPAVIVFPLRLPWRPAPVRVGRSDQYIVYVKCIMVDLSRYRALFPRLTGTFGRYG